MMSPVPTHAVISDGALNRSMEKNLMNNTTATQPTANTTPLPELAPMLKQLRLSGITETLDQRNREAIEHKMTVL